MGVFFGSERVLCSVSQNYYHFVTWNLLTPSIFCSVLKCSILSLPNKMPPAVPVSTRANTHKKCMLFEKLSSLDFPIINISNG